MRKVLTTVLALILLLAGCSSPSKTPGLPPQTGGPAESQTIRVFALENDGAVDALIEAYHAK